MSFDCNSLNNSHSQYNPRKISMINTEYSSGQKLIGTIRSPTMNNSTIKHSYGGSPSESRICFNSSQSYESSLNQLLIKVKLYQGKVAKIKDKNTKEFTQFKVKINKLNQKHHSLIDTQSLRMATTM